MKPSAFIIDIDGTLADSEACHLHQEEIARGDYSWFHNAILDYKPVASMVEIVKLLQKYHIIIYLTYRSENVRTDTVKWLKANGINSEHLIMNPDDGKFKSSAKYKKHKLKELVKRFNILGAFDDNDECIDMYNDKGITAFKPYFISELT